MWARAIASLVFVFGLVVGNAGMAAQAAEREDPPKLDVDAALAALRTQQIYRAPGAVATLDRELVREKLPDNARVLIAPFKGEVTPGGNYSTDKQYIHQVYQPIEDWVDTQGIELIYVEGLEANYVPSEDVGVTAVPSELPGLRRITAYRDVTSTVWTLIAHMKGNPNAEEVGEPPEVPTVEPTTAQVDVLVGRLRQSRVYNAPDRVEAVELPVNQVNDMLGVTVRVAALPSLRQGDPLVKYAPALARRFPDDLIFVAHGRWIEVAGGGEQKLISARNYVYGRSIRVALAEGTPTWKMLANMLQRYDTLHTQHPFARAQPIPFDLGRTIAGLAPWLLGGSAVLLGGVPTVRWWRARRRRQQNDRDALRQRRARTHSEIVELGSRVYGDTGNAELRAAASERYETARELFDEAHTAQAMEQISAVVAEGNQLLERAEQEA